MGHGPDDRDRRGAPAAPGPELRPVRRADVRCRRMPGADRNVTDDHRPKTRPRKPRRPRPTTRSAPRRARFLEAHASLRQGFGDTTITLGATDTSKEAETAHVERCRAWQRTLFENGWAGIAWPAEYGGRGGTLREARIFAQEESRFDASASVFAVGDPDGRPDDHGARHRRAEGVLPHAHAARRRHLVPAVLANRAPVPTSPGSPHAPSATATSGSSTVRRCGRRARSTATTGCSSPAPTPTCRSTRASPTSCSTCARPASTCAR